MTIADLRHKVTLQQRVEVSDGQGGRTVSWTTVGTMLANVNDGAGREQLLSGGGMLMAQSPTTVTIRYRAGLSVKDRILFGTRTLDIADIADLGGRRRFQQLACIEVAA